MGFFFSYKEKFFFDSRVDGFYYWDIFLRLWIFRDIIIVDIGDCEMVSFLFLEESK